MRTLQIYWVLKISVNQVQFVVGNCKHLIHRLSMQCSHKLKVCFLLQMKHQVSMKVKRRILLCLCWDKKDFVALLQMIWWLFRYFCVYTIYNTEAIILPNLRWWKTTYNMCLPFMSWSICTTVSGTCVTASTIVEIEPSPSLLQGSKIQRFNSINQSSSNNPKWGRVQRDNYSEHRDNYSALEWYQIVSCWWVRNAPHNSASFPTWPGIDPLGSTRRLWGWIQYNL